MLRHTLVEAIPFLFLSISLLSTLVSSTGTGSATFINGNHYIFDTDGSAIDSTSGKIDFLGGIYIWYGLSFACGSVFCGILSYSSPDLVHWQNNGFLFDPNTTQIETLCSPDLSGNCGRPHIVYNEAANEYVLWVNAGAPGYALFTSTNPTTGYTLLEDRALVGVQTEGTMAGDFSVELINGTGYLAYSLIDFTTTGASIWPPFLQSIYIQQLTPDLRNTTGDTHQLLTTGDLVDFEAESPDIWQRGDYFYVTASNTCGFCTGTLLLVYRSKSIQGPWERQIISDDTCGGQSTGVLVLPSPSPGGATTYLHQADIFSDAPAALTGIRTGLHGHQFQQLIFNQDGSVQDLDCSSQKQTTISFTQGSNSNSNITGLALTATDSSGEDNAYTVTCDLPEKQLYQTWASSKAGRLTEVGINMAGDSPTGNLSITIFRYSNNSNFFTPRYVWETLGTTNIPPSQITQSMQVLRVPLVNATVAEGDRLGIALVNGGITPMCHPVVTEEDVMFDVETSTRTLFAIGANQVSFRGKEGKTPPVKVLPGAQIKWYAIVE